MSDCEADPTAQQLQELGLQVKNMRLQRGLTLDEVAALSGVSKSMLSMLERGKANCTIGTLVSISNAMRVPFSQLFQGTQAPSSNIIRSKDRRVTRGKDTERLLYVFDTNRNLEVSENVFYPGANTGAKPLVHAGWECGILLEGTLKVNVDGEEHLLEAGDCFVFESSRPHWFSNESTTMTRVLWINAHDPGP